MNKLLIAALPLSFFSLAIALLPSGKAIAGELFVGAATVDITPDGPVALAGQRHLRIAREVQSPLAAAALVVDTRNNGGGWLHDDLVGFLSGKDYVFFTPRGKNKGDLGAEPHMRWSRPVTVVMSESNYSDAHFFPWAYAELEIGPTVGMPVPGTATAVWWERLHTGDLIFGIPQVGTKGASGVYLENAELKPTHEVRIRPEDAAAGRDTQIEKAVEVMLEMIEQQQDD